MGFFALPNILIFQILLPLVSPFIDIMFAWGGVIQLPWYDKHYHPETANAATVEKLLTCISWVFLFIDFMTSLLAFSLEPRHPANKGDGWLLFHVWLQRFSYRQIFSIVLFRTLKRAVEGRPFNWEKIERTARMSRAHGERLRRETEGRGSANFFQATALSETRGGLTEIARASGSDGRLRPC
jgi:hypothetical protein